MNAAQQGTPADVTKYAYADLAPRLSLGRYHLWEDSVANQPILRGIFLTSETPAKAAQFYREVAGLELERVGDESYSYWKTDKGGIQLAIHGAREFSDYTSPANSNSNLTHLYFKIDNQAAFLGHLEELGTKPYAVDDVVVTVEDPDGRKVMFGTA